MRKDRTRPRALSFNHGRKEIVGRTPTQNSDTWASGNCATSPVNSADGISRKNSRAVSFGPTFHWHNYKASPFVPRTVKSAHDWMTVRVNGQHGKRFDHLACGPVCPTIPYGSDRKRLTVLPMDAPAHSFARIPARFIKPRHRHKTELPLPPCFAVARLFRHRFRPGVVCAPPNRAVFRPTGNQAECRHIHPQCSGIGSDDRRNVAGKGFWGVLLFGRAASHPL
jgi:hypothetical protein